MENFHELQDREIVFSTGSSSASKQIRRAIDKKLLRKIVPNIYTSNFEDSDENIVHRNLYLILGKLFSGAVLSHRTALEGGINKEGLIILTYKYTKKINLPGVTVRLVEGKGAREGDTPFMGGLFISSRHRAVLENLQPTKGSNAKSLPQKQVEIFLNKLCNVRGESELLDLRTKANTIAQPLGFQKEYQKLDKIIGEMLRTRAGNSLVSKEGVLRASGLPFDSSRIELFSKLTSKLTSMVLPVIEANEASEQILSNIAFFEAYFSNFIEGTEFDIEEARDIVFNNKVLINRTMDAHDILGTYKLTSSKSEMKSVPGTFEDFIDIIKRRHYTLMSTREDKHPGVFKTVINRAGETIFVSPELVLGTLKQALELYASLEQGLMRAIFIMFVISEVHPFDDGNGRIARIMMNAELVKTNQHRIIIPTVYRDDYLLTLRRLSRSGDPEAYINMLVRAQAFSASINFSDYQSCIKELTHSNAFKRSYEGKLTF